MPSMQINDFIQKKMSEWLETCCGCLLGRQGLGLAVEKARQVVVVVELVVAGRTLAAQDVMWG